MRVTDTMLWDLSRRHVVRAQARLFAATEQVSSGRRVERPSDAPADMSQLRSIEASLARLHAGEVSSTHATLQLRGAESALAETGSVLVRAREIAIAGADGGQLSTGRAALAQEVASLREQVRALANTRVADSYVFGGFKTATPPFLTDGSFIGDDGARDVEVLPGLRVTANVSGARAFTAAGGVDVMAVLEQLETDLLNDDVVGIGARMDDLDVAIRQVLAERTEAGTRLARIESADAVRADSVIRLEEARSGLRDIDVPAAITEMVQAQTALRLALETASQILQITSRAA